MNLVPNKLVVEVDEFESSDSALRGEMTTTITLSQVNCGTNLTAIHDGLPPSVSVSNCSTSGLMGQIG